MNVLLRSIQMQISVTQWFQPGTMLQVLLVLMTAYSSAAMGQLFFFHVVLIRKVIIMVAL